jgi:hypothetical protein
LVPEEQDLLELCHGEPMTMKCFEDFPGHERVYRKWRISLQGNTHEWSPIRQNRGAMKGTGSTKIPKSITVRGKKEPILRIAWTSAAQRPLFRIL